MREKKAKLSKEEKKLLKQQEKEAKKQKKQENTYVPLKGLLGNAVDYNVYTMSLTERILGFLIGFAGGFVVIYVFFRVLIPSAITGILTGIFIQKPFEDYLLKRRKRTLLLQFKDLLEALTASYSAGLNTNAAFEDAYQDLLNIYGEKADIVQEVKIINTGIKYNLIMEDLLFDFADRSGQDDIYSFASVFSVSNRQGADIKKIVSDSKDIINDKIEIQMDIETMLAGNKNQLNIMMGMPLIIMLSLSSMGSISAVTNTPINVAVKVGVLILFGFSYILGRRIVNIKL